jgi:hypothetical protein
MLLGICRIAGQVLLVQVISHHAEEHARDVIGALGVPGLPAPPPAPRPRGRPSAGLLAAIWAGALFAIAASMAFWWLQLRRPSRRQRK